eukprot:m.29249 g.29249  ORF g.29249 m.29249 type:complete len:532 (+) comp4578_c0_seq2:318-1913(+)
MWFGRGLPYRAVLHYVRRAPAMPLYRAVRQLQHGLTVSTGGARTSGGLPLATSPAHHTARGIGAGHARPYRHSYTDRSVDAAGETRLEAWEDVDGWDSAAVALWLSGFEDISHATVMRLLAAGIDGSRLKSLDKDSLAAVGVHTGSQCNAVLMATGAAIEEVDDHAVLSPSASQRWLNCAPSARLEQAFAHLDTHTSYARQGMFAHELAAVRLKYAFGQLDSDTYSAIEARLSESSWYTEDLIEHVDGYVQWSVEQADGLPLRLVELPVRMDQWVPQGWGTADLVLASESLVHVVDFKYGRGRVPTTNNTQLLLYALGAVQTAALGWDASCTDVKTSIYQPRSPGATSVTHSRLLHELLVWAESDVRPTARQAYDGVGQFQPGSHCRYCLVRGICRARSTQATRVWTLCDNLDSSLASLPRVESMSHNAVEQAFRGRTFVKQWLADVEDYALVGDKLAEDNKDASVLSKDEVSSVLDHAPSIRQWLAEVTQRAQSIGRTRPSNSRSSKADPAVQTPDGPLSERIMVLPRQS